MSKEEIYQALATMYRYTPSQIAEMNPFQQLSLLSINEGQSSTISFDNMDDYIAWKRSSGK